jgi:hypothetical protein
MDMVEDTDGCVQLGLLGEWVEALQLGKEFLIGPGFVLQQRG